MSFQQEKDELARVLLNMKQLGWEAWELDDGGGFNLVHHLDTAGIVEGCAAVDVCWMRFIKDGDKSGVMLIVWGNGPEDLIADAMGSYGFSSALDAAQHAECPHLQL